MPLLAPRTAMRMVRPHLTSSAAGPIVTVCRRFLPTFGPHRSGHPLLRRPPTRPVVLEAKTDGPGGTERGTRGYRCPVICLSVPPTSTASAGRPPFEYPLVPPVPRRGQPSPETEKFIIPAS